MSEVSLRVGDKLGGDNVCKALTARGKNDCDVTIKRHTSGDRRLWLHVRIYVISLAAQEDRQVIHYWSRWAHNEVVFQSLSNFTISFMNCCAIAIIVIILCVDRTICI